MIENPNKNKRMIIRASVILFIFSEILVNHSVHNQRSWSNRESSQVKWVFRNESKICSNNNSNQQDFVDTRNDAPSDLQVFGLKLIDHLLCALVCLIVCDCHFVNDCEPFEWFSQKLYKVKIKNRVILYYIKTHEFKWCENKLNLDLTSISIVSTKFSDFEIWFNFWFM